MSEVPSDRATDSVREERKVVSVVFTDIVGFTGRAEELDPEDVRALLRPYHERVRAELERFGATVEKFVGDAIMAVFGAPVAHEDDAERAVRAAVAVRDALAELNESDPSLALEIRTAVTTGEALVTLSADPRAGEGIVAGDIVNTASRLQEAAPAGAIVVDEKTYRTTRAAVAYDELQPVELKGKRAPFALWRVIAIGGPDREPAPTTPFVGRTRELALLEQSHERAVLEPGVQLVTVAGEPGAGKSRILIELRRALEERGTEATWRQGRCLPYGDGITFWALGEIVKAEAGILESDGPEEAAAKLAAAVDRVAEPDERDWLRTRIAPLVGLAGDGGSAEQTEAFAAWRTFLEAIASHEPLVVAVEDLHWADPSLLDFLDHLADWASDVPLFVVCTARPELFDGRPGWGGGKRNSTTISLAPLSTGETEELVSALLEEAAPSAAALRERSGGNPLYIEEFARMLADRGDPQDIETATLPETVHAVIAARIDALPPAGKAVLQDASVVGTVFWSGAVAAIGGQDEQRVTDDLQQLARKELVRRRRRSSIESEHEYSFWHVLVRDVAYGQIPRVERARRHRAAAGWIEQIAGARVGDHAELLAHHHREALTLLRAAGLAQEAEQLEPVAARFLDLAGDRAISLDRGRAESYYEEAVELLAPGTREHGRTLVKLATANFWAARFEEADERLEQAIGELVDIGDVGAAGEALAWQSFVAYQGGDGDRALALVSRSLELLEREPPGPPLAIAYAFAARDAMMRGRFTPCVALSERAIELADRFQVHGQAVRARQFRGIARFGVGDLDGRRDLEEALRLAEERGLGFETATAYQNLADVVWFTDGPQLALELLDKALELATRRGLTQQALWDLFQSLPPRFDLGRWDDVVRIADDIVEQVGGLGIFALNGRVYAELVAFFRGKLTLDEDLLPGLRKSQDRQTLVPAVTLAALAAARRGDAAAVAALADEQLELMVDNASYGGQTVTDAVRACVAVGAHEPAVRLVESAEHPAARPRYAVLTARAVIAESDGELEHAAAGYREAAESWARFGSVFEEGQALLGLARCLAGLERGDETAAPLARAREVFAAIGARSLLAEVEALS